MEASNPLIPSCSTQSGIEGRWDEGTEVGQGTLFKFLCLILNFYFLFFLVFKNLNNTYSYDLWINSLQREPPLNHLHFVVYMYLYMYMDYISKWNIIFNFLFDFFSLIFLFNFHCKTGLVCLRQGITMQHG